MSCNIAKLGDFHRALARMARAIGLIAVALVAIAASQVTAQAQDVTPPDAPTLSMSRTEFSLQQRGALFEVRGEPGAVAEVFRSGLASRQWGGGTTNASGIYAFNSTFRSTFPDGDYEVWATLTDAAGNVSARSASISITIDFTPPPPPVIVTSSQTFTGAPPTIAGTAEPFSTVDVYAYDGIFLRPLIGTTTADASGNWMLSFSDADFPYGTMTVGATATDTFGNTGDPSNYVEYTRESVVTAPTFTLGKTSFNFRNPNTSIRVTGTPGMTVSIFTSHAPATAFMAIRLPADGSGIYDTGINFSSLPDGSYDVWAVQRDAEGTESPRSAVTSITRDATPPAAPVITTPDQAFAGQPVLVEGTAEPGSSVSVRLRGSVRPAVPVDASGNWSTLIEVRAFREGDNIFDAYAVDPAGNFGTDYSNPLNITRAAGVVSTPTLSVDRAVAGTSPSPKFFGVTDPSATVRLYWTPAATGVESTSPASVTTAFGDGRWEKFISMNAFAEGEYTFRARATNATGDESAYSAPVALTVDRTPPDAPVITSDAAIVGQSAAIVRGTAEPGSLMEIHVGGTKLNITFYANGSGTWSVGVLPARLADGPNDITVRAIDAAGNASAFSAPVVLTKEQPGPTVTLSTASTTVNGPFDVLVTINPGNDDFSRDNISITNGTLVSFEAQDRDFTRYLLRVSPDAEGTVSVQVVPSTGPEGVNLTSEILEVTYVAIPFTVSLSTGATSNDAPFVIEVSLSALLDGDSSDEPIASYLTVTGGTATSTATLGGAGTVFSVRIEPDGTGPTTISLAAGVLRNVDGTLNQVSNTLVIETATAAGLLAEAEGELVDIITSDATSRLRGSLDASGQMTKDARLRLVQRMAGNSGAPLGYASEGSSSVSGGVFAASHSLSTAMMTGQAGLIRHLTSNFAFSADGEGALSADLRVRHAWEMDISESFVLGAFVGVHARHSRIDRGFDGDIFGIGAEAGVYGVKALTPNLFIDGFASVGITSNSLDLSDGTLAVTADYVSTDYLAGVSLSGRVPGENWELWPRLSVNFAQGAYGSVAFLGTATGLAPATLTSAIGTVQLLEASLAPELKLSLDGVDINASAHLLSVEPNVTCGQLSTVTGTSSHCGYGARLGYAYRQPQNGFGLSADIAANTGGGATRWTAGAKLQGRF